MISTRLLNKVTKLRLSEKVRKFIIGLLTEAYEQGRKDAIADVYITLYDDMRKSDHRDALDIISSNF